MNPFEPGAWGGAIGFGTLGATLGAGLVIITLIFVVWELVWKGLALWHAAKNGQLWWFVALLLIHTLGILEIIYLFGFRTDRKSSPLFKRSAPPASVPPSTPSSGAM